MEDNIKVLTLDSIATLKQLIGGGGGGNNITLLGSYTASPENESAYSAPFINSTLFSSKVLLGSNISDSSDVGTSQIAIGNGITIGALNSSVGPGQYNIVLGDGGTTLDGSGYSVLIGRNAQPTFNGNYIVSIGDASKACSGGVAIGAASRAGGTNSAAVYNGPAAFGREAQALHDFSVALGSFTTTARAREVSFGRAIPSGTLPQTRFLANVTAGTLDTDATNLAQVRGATVGDVLYTSSDAASTITLTTPVSQYEKVEIIGSWTMPHTASTTPLQVIGHWHLNDQDNSRTFQLRAVDLDPANNQKTEIVETWSFTGSTTLEMISGAMISGDLTDQTIETVDTPSIIITKVIGVKAL